MPSPLRLCVRRSVEWRPEGTTTVVSLRLPSDVDCVEEAVELVARHCLAGVWAHAATWQRLRFRLQVVLAEALTNAILRGNQEDQAKWVDVRAELRADAIQVSVSDEGPGFDPAAVPEPTRPERLELPGGRGLYLIRQLVDAVHFNEQGNSICMTLRRR